MLTISQFSTSCPSSQQQQEQDPTNLYISNLPLSMDEQELENMLKPFGHVISTRILRDANGLSRGVGFARYAQGNTHIHTCMQTVSYTCGSSTQYLVLLSSVYEAALSTDSCDFLLLKQILHADCQSQCRIFLNELYKHTTQNNTDS